MERTLAIVKPDAVRNKHFGKIIDRILEEGFEIIGLEMTQLTKEKAEEFYAVHKDRPFFESLVGFMTSGPIVVIALERKDAIATWRKLMGATNAAEAEEGSIRKLYAGAITDGASREENATHGSDSPENAKLEISFFFPELS